MTNEQRDLAALAYRRAVNMGTPGKRYFAATKMVHAFGKIGLTEAEASGYVETFAEATCADDTPDETKKMAMGVLRSAYKRHYQQNG